MPDIQIVCIALIVILAVSGVIIWAYADGRMVSRKRTDARLADKDRELQDRTADRDGWRNFGKALDLKNERLSRTNAELAQELAELRKLYEALLSHRGPSNTTDPK